MQKPYRIGVVGVFTNNQGEVLVGERADLPGVWQLPQGGVEAGESLEQAILREMQEELGVKEMTIIKAGDQSFYYEFPPELIAPISKKYRGQEQWWFLLALPKQCTLDDLKGDDEFSRFSWMNANKLLEQTVAWKRQCYGEGLRQLQLID